MHSYDNGSGPALKEARQHILDSCDEMLHVMTTTDIKVKTVAMKNEVSGLVEKIAHVENGISSYHKNTQETQDEVQLLDKGSEKSSLPDDASGSVEKKKKKSRSVLFGAVMGGK